MHNSVFLLLLVCLVSHVYENAIPSLLVCSHHGALPLSKTLPCVSVWDPCLLRPTVCSCLTPPAFWWRILSTGFLRENSEVNILKLYKFFFNSSFKVPILYLYSNQNFFTLTFLDLKKLTLKCIHVHTYIFIVVMLIYHCINFRNVTL